jgi:hypothetical protein
MAESSKAFYTHTHTHTHIHTNINTHTHTHTHTHTYKYIVCVRIQVCRAIHICTEVMFIYLPRLQSHGLHQLSRMNHPEHHCNFEHHY